jgi:hypothetical protein
MSSVGSSQVNQIPLFDLESEQAASPPAAQTPPVDLEALRQRLGRLLMQLRDAETTPWPDPSEAAMWTAIFMRTVVYLGEDEVALWRRDFLAEIKRLNMVVPSHAA